ncbi:MAG: hypothetical protein KY468_02335 [Armatimonadetes bacterium]|nr:hypothetical protein [Armatimonadota bacterium]
MVRRIATSRFALGLSLFALSASVSWGQVNRPNIGSGPVRRPGAPPPPPTGVAPGAQAGNTTTGSARGFVPPGIELVAGVRLDKPAEMPPALNNIRAVAYDPQQKRFYLVGQHNPKLPAFRPEDLAVALKSFRQGYPAVSIEAPVVDGQMTVKYYGGIENTRFGKVLFEADRLMKSLALGRDTVTQEYLRPGVRGYESEVRKLQRMGGVQRPHASHRYWFRPAQISMTLSEDGHALRFDEVKVEVRTEYVPAVAEGESEPAAEEFARHFTEYYDDFARAYPVFAELKELAKVTALAQWLHESGIPLDALGLDKAVIPEVETAKTTPVGFAQALELRPGGVMRHRMEGGVAFRFWREEASARLGEAPVQRGNWTVSRSGKARDLLQSVMKRPSPEAHRWFSTFRPGPAGPAGGAASVAPAPLR